MSQRVKKPGRPEEAQGKRRRRRPSGSDGDEGGTMSGSNSGGNGSLSGMWTPRHLSDLKVSSIYNRNSAEAPAELYRKDLISAMKLPDSEPLTPEDYWLITDTWKQEWEKGVQVPVNPESLPQSEVIAIRPVAERSHDFRLPKKKYVRVTHDDFFNPDYHQLVSTAARAEKVCSYDLDDIDAAWLGCLNGDRSMQTQPIISEFLMEQIIEELELQCWEQVQTILKSQEGLGIEYDENVICDVCRSPESEEGNEMVFCDSCNICVHQACYGITSIPSGSFLCRTCTLGIKPSCVLCPNMAGAMKATRSGQKWAHVACAIWIPEVSIGSVEKMEPITKISSIPQSRWSLVCVICKDKTGACIQCSVKTCKTAYHVTCAFKNGLEMKPIIVDENADDGIKLRSYCQKHSANINKKEKTTHSGSDDDAEKKRARAMTAEERNLARAEKLQQIEAEFFKYVRLKDVSQNLAVDMDIVNLVYSYWKLKRRSLNNRPLVPPRPETTQLLTQQQEKDLEQMKMFVQLRQDLERVRNLCYMVSRREKLSRSYLRLREQTFQKQLELLSEDGLDVTTISGPEKAAIEHANHGPSIYDQFYSQPGTGPSNYKDYDSLVTLIGGEDKRELINGLVKPKKERKSKPTENPYKKTFVNGAVRRRSKSGAESASSLSESEISAKGTASAKNKSGRKPLQYLFDTDSEVDAVIMTNTGRIGVGKLPPSTKKNSKVRGLKQMEKTLAKSSTSDSDNLELSSPASKLKAKSTSNRGKNIYSDTESEPDAKKKSALNKTQAKVPKGKKNKPKSGPKGNAESNTGILQSVTVIPVPVKQRGRTAGKKRKADAFEPTELIVPQREAAKKASESIRAVKNPKGKDQPGNNDTNELIPSPKDTIISRDTNKNIKPQQETLSDSEESKPAVVKRKASTKERKNTASTSLKQKQKDAAPLNQPVSKAELKNEFEFDEDGDANGNNVSYVPQRQAAKKAAEHIRSGLSNIVAARLIIEDEMEASRKKAKHEKNSKLPKGESMKSPSRQRPKSSSPIRDLFGEIIEKRNKTKVTGGKVPPSQLKTGKIQASKSNAVKEETIREKEPGWPFLDKGSQSACRRSRERSSSSSSSSSSSGSSSSSSSSSSSRSSSSSQSSSPGSASPEPCKPKPLPNSATPINTNKPGPGRKLKTSERSPVNRTRAETSPRAKPIPKGRGPANTGPGRNPPPATIKTTSPRRNRASKSPNKRQHQNSTSSCESPTRRASDHSPTSSKFNLSKTKPEEENIGGKRESAFNKVEKAFSARSSKERTPPKAIGRGEVALSSESEPESPKKLELSPPKPKTTIKPSSISPDLKNKPMPKTKKKELGLLSEDSDTADEKENSCLPSSSPAKSQKPVSTISTILSPLTPSTENKEKEPSKEIDTEAEPEPKRLKLEPSPSNHTPGAQTEPLATCSTTTSQAPIPGAIETGNSGIVKPSLFSPPIQSKEFDVAEFDNDLYDLARSVTEEYNASGRDGALGGGSLSFSISQDLLDREDNKEDSARATMNLVEKLRLQHLKKSGPPQRTSLDGSASDLGDTSENPPKSPISVDSPLKSPVPGSVQANPDAVENKNLPDALISPAAQVKAETPVTTKPMLPDECWVPPTSYSESLPQNSDPSATSGRQITMSHGFGKDVMDPPQLRIESDHSSANGVSDLLKEPEIPNNQTRFPFQNLQIQQPKSEQQKENPSVEPPVTLPSLPVSTPQLNIQQALENHCGMESGLGASFALNHGHPPFMYPFSSNMANVVTSLASGNINFFHPQIQPPKSSPNLPLSGQQSVSTSYNMLSQILSPGKQAQQLNEQFLSSLPFCDGNNARRNDSSLNNVVNTAMPPISKPPLTSPSILLAPTSTMTHAPPPTVSNVAQIIESVIQASNNLNINSNMLQNNMNHNPQGSMTMANLGLMSLANSMKMAVSQAELQFSSAVPASTFNSKPCVTTPANQPPKTVSSAESAVSDFSAILTNKTNENNIHLSPIKSVFRENSAQPPILSVNTTSPQLPLKPATGRAKKATTPRKSEEISPKTKVKAEKKTVGASPGRVNAKGSVTPRRTGGRGKSKGKNFILRKDLAGTVYDIDFDEFEENTEEKFDWKILRERRKSTETNADSRKSEGNPSPIHSEKFSPRYKQTYENENSNRFTIERNPNLVIQAPLPGPVDMRTYSGYTPNESLAHLNPPMHRASAGCTSVTELEELDKTLEELASSSKPTLPSVLSVTGDSQKNLSSLANASETTFDSNFSNSKESITTNASDDRSRNQLKVKIKGPFLDANYSSQNMQQSTFPQAPLQHSSEPPIHHPYMMGVPSMSNNSSSNNLRRMRKKELLRQYWYQDMNMDGSSLNTSYYGNDVGLSGAPNPYPFSRTAITIPKAVASAIIPSKDEYGLDPSDLMPLPTPIPPPPPEKKKRSRGLREMAALGIIPEGAYKGDRRRDKSIAAQIESMNQAETNSRKRKRACTTNKARSTFIPPTLVEAEESAPCQGTNSKPPQPNTANSSSIIPGNHPTPKLKIKFGDLTASSCISSIPSTLETNHLDDSDKETPSKKAKGRPPKKRGISSEVPTPPAPSLQQLKLESLKYREMIMKDFDQADKQRSKSSGKKKKKSKRSKKDNEHMDQSSRLQSPETELKVTPAAGPKLILRFGKNRVEMDTGNNNNETIKIKTENGPVVAGNQETTMSAFETKRGSPIGSGDDSGFTGSSEGSIGCATLKTETSSADKMDTLDGSGRKGDSKNDILFRTQNPGSDSGVGSGLEPIVPPPKKSESTDSMNKYDFAELSPSALVPLHVKKNKEPIRLKLLRCYEGYSTEKEVDRENTNPKQADTSCEVR